MNNIDIAKITGDIKSMNEQIQKTSELIGDLIKKQGDLNKELAGAKGLKETTDNLNKSKLAQSEIEQEGNKLLAQRNKLIASQDEALKQLTIDNIKEQEAKKQYVASLKEEVTGEKASAKAKKELEQATKAKAKADLEETQSVKGLQAANKKLREERNNLIITDKNYQQNLKRLNDQINKNDKTIQAAGSTLEKQKNQIGDYKIGWTSLVGVFGAVTGALASVGITFGAFKKVLASSRTLTEEFNTVMKGAEFVTKAFFSTIRSGDFSNFLSNMGKAYERGKEYEDGMARIAKRQIAVNFLHKEEKRNVADLEEKLRDVNLTTEQRLAAGLEWKKIMEASYDREIILRKQEVETELTALNLKGRTLEVAKETLKAYLEEDALNPNLRKNAEEINSLLSSKQSLIKTIESFQGRGVKIDQNQLALLKSQVAEIEGRTDNTAKYAKLLREIEGQKGAGRVDTAIVSMGKAVDAEEAFYYENKRILKAINSLTKESNTEKEEINRETLDKIELKTNETEKAITAFLREQLKQRLGEEKKQTLELTDELIKRNDAAMFELNKPAVAKPKDIYELLGITMSDDQKDAINTAKEYAINALNEVADAKIKAAYRAREAADLEMDAVRKRLDYEMEARSNGYASNVAQAQKDLALAKKTQDKAIAQQRQAEREKAAIASIQQAGNLVTGAAMMFSQLGAWAFPVIGAMFASFAYAKIRSAQLSRQNYGDGDYSVLQGGSHASGNDIYLGRRGGVDEFAEGGEARAIINKRSTSKYRRILPDLIKSLNKGTFENNYLSNGDGSIINVMGGMSKDLESDVKEIKKQGERKYFTNGKGQTVEVYKNIRRTYVN